MPRYLVTGRVFGRNGELLDGKTVEKKGEVSHPAFSKVETGKGKKLEVATPDKPKDKE
jgi:hypothetical protein